MSDLSDARKDFQDISRKSLFNEWLGLEVTKVQDGEVEIRIPWRKELGQTSGFLHGGVIGAMIDAVCGFAVLAVTGGRALASNYSVNCLSPAIGDAFVARGRVIKAGKRQVFTAAELFAEKDGALKLVATGQTILMMRTD